MYTKATIKFVSGEVMEAVTNAEHLGSSVTQKHLTRKELENRLGKALETAHKLKVIFKKCNAAKNGKLGSTMRLFAVSSPTGLTPYILLTVFALDSTLFR